jgi:5-methylcytosine-specific restriction protein A
MQLNFFDFQEELDRAFIKAHSMGRTNININSGELHKKVGGYPGRNHRMPLCCEVMKKNMKKGDQILSQPPKGKGASLTIRYKLPR